MSYYIFNFIHQGAASSNFILFLFCWFYFVQGRIINRPTNSKIKICFSFSLNFSFIKKELTFSVTVHFKMFIVLNIKLVFFYFWVSGSINNSLLDKIRPRKPESNKIWECGTLIIEIKNVLEYMIFKSRNTLKVFI